MIDWSSYNRSLVSNGEMLFYYYFLDGWDNELNMIDEVKQGKPFVFLNSFILAISYIHYSFRLPYRHSKGIIHATGKRLPSNSPSYGHICKRTNKLNIDIKREQIDDDGDNEHFVISIDITGIKKINSCQWMYEKWNVLNNKKGYSNFT